MRGDCRDQGYTEGTFCAGRAYSSRQKLPAVTFRGMEGSPQRSTPSDECGKSQQKNHSCLAFVSFIVWVVSRDTGPECFFGSVLTRMEGINSLAGDTNYMLRQGESTPTIQALPIQTTSLARHILASGYCNTPPAPRGPGHSPETACASFIKLIPPSLPGALALQRSSTLYCPTHNYRRCYAGSLGHGSVTTYALSA